MHPVYLISVYLTACQTFGTYLMRKFDSFLFTTRDTADNYFVFYSVNLYCKFKPIIRPIDIVGVVFANGLLERGSIPGRFLTKTKKNRT